MSHYQTYTKFILSQNIERTLKQDGFMGAIIYGSQRLGKSSYAAQVLYEIYKDWDVVNDHILFKLEDVVGVMKTAIHKRKKIPAIVWDDAGVHANKLLYFQNRELVQYLQNLTDVIGINLGALLITTPNPLNLLRAIRGYEFYRVKVYRRDDFNGRTAVGYRSSMLPSGMRTIRRMWHDNYKVRLPDAFWKKYMVKRQGYLDEAISQLENLANRRNDPKEFQPSPIGIGSYDTDDDERG